MLQRQHFIPSFKNFAARSQKAVRPTPLCSEADAEPSESEPELEDAARSERDYVRERLRQELGREPTDEELDEWLRQHTEGY